MRADLEFFCQDCKQLLISLSINKHDDLPLIVIPGHKWKHQGNAGLN